MEKINTYRSVFLWSLFAILISLIGYFAIINEVEYDRYNKVFTSVDKLQELEGLMNQYALQNSNHMGTSDSILKQHYLEYQKHYDFLCEERELVHVEQQPILGILEDSLQILFIQKQTLIQQFQEKNFILEKALLGMSLESISLSEQIPQKNLQDDVNLLINQVFIYYVKNEWMSKEKVGFYKKELNTYKHLIKDNRVLLDVELLLRDTKIILDQKPIVDDLIHQIISLSLKPTIQEVYTIYSKDYKKRMEKKQLIKIALYALCVLLCLLVIYFLFELLKRSKDLRYLNNNLESQIVERTSQIQEREKLLNEFLSLLPLGIYVVDATRKPVYVNEMCKKLFPTISEYQYAEHFVSALKLYHETIDEECDVVVEHPVYLALESKQKVETVFCISNQKDEKVHISMLSTPVFKTEKRQVLKYVILAFEDITEQKQREQELIKAREIAEKAGKAKEEFLAVMSHELRTPLNAVVGLTHLLVEQEFLSTQKENLDTLKFSAENLMLIINDILDFSKIQSGKITFENTPISLEDILKKIQDTFVYQSEKNRTDFLIEQENLPMYVMGDSLRLVQIINNLVSNAIKFTHNGTVILRVSKVRETLKKSTFLFEIKDTGIGIPADKLATIFNSFEQASSVTTRKYGGTGLGLAITQRLVELQSGKIWVESEENKGSTFFVELTFQKIANDFVKPERLAYTPLNLRILLVEDNAINQMVAMQFLKQWDNDIICVDDGKEAIDMLAKDFFDVVLMDIHMPNMDGIQATEHIRKEGNLVPIIALTATVSEMRDKIFQVGMNGIVHKPFNPQELYQILKEIAELKQK